ncbi:hypothetical protein Ciccas_004443, partial [Cichlidogyrus casuarinus]
TFWEERRNLAIARILKKHSSGDSVQGPAPRSTQAGRRVTSRQNLVSHKFSNQFYPHTEPNSPHLFNSSDSLQVRNYLQNINQSRYYDWKKTDTVKRRPFSAPVPHGQHRSRRMPESITSHQQP